ncbi:MAG: PilZ domain-containing protein [Bdellovibrionales bacterium]|nr:PilZ domain-containing protein [Bdellovibrionales bacterium]
MIFRVMHVSPPPPPSRGTEEHIVSGGSGINNLLDKKYFTKNEIEQTKSLSLATGEFVLRSQKRYNKRLSVEIIGENGQEFKTFTRDVSVGGMNVEDSIPDWVAGYFKVRISKAGSKQLIELTCCLIENQIPGARFRLAILPLESVEDEKNLETWLAA